VRVCCTVSFSFSKPGIW